MINKIIEGVSWDFETPSKCRLKDFPRVVAYFNGDGWYFEDEKERFNSISEMSLLLKDLLYELALYKGLTKPKT